MRDPHDRTYNLSKAAVAIKGTSEGQAVLVAKGRGAVAEQILDLAFANDVKVREDKALVGILEAFELDSPIPPPALDAVAVVLAHVYAARHGHAPKGPDASPSSFNPSGDV